MTANEGVLAAVAICGWIAYGMMTFVAKDTLRMAREMYEDLYGEEPEDSEPES